MPDVQSQKTERADLRTRFSSVRQPEKTGRPQQSKDRITQAFLYDLAEDYTAHGKTVIAAAREADPVRYLNIVAALVPKEFHIKAPLSGYDDERLTAAIEVIMAMRRPEDAKEIQADVRLND